MCQEERSPVEWRPCDIETPRPAEGKYVLAAWKHQKTGNRFVHESYFRDCPPRWQGVHRGNKEPEWQVTHWAPLPALPLRLINEEENNLKTFIVWVDDGVRYINAREYHVNDQDLVFTVEADDGKNTTVATFMKARVTGVADREFVNTGEGEAKCAKKR